MRFEYWAIMFVVSYIIYRLFFDSLRELLLERIRNGLERHRNRKQRRTLPNMAKYHLRR